MQMSDIIVNKHFKNNYLNEYNAYLFNIYFISGSVLNATVIKKVSESKLSFHYNDPD